jgi:hypothetical protein
MSFILEKHVAPAELGRSLMNSTTGAKEKAEMGGMNEAEGVFVFDGRKMFNVQFSMLNVQLWRIENMILKIDWLTIVAE